MITYRLADSLPTKKLNEELVLLGAPHSDAGQDMKRRKAIEKLLEQSHGSCLLRTPDIAEKVIEG